VFPLFMQLKPTNLQGSCEKWKAYNPKVGKSSPPILYWPNAYSQLLYSNLNMSSPNSDDLQQGFDASVPTESYTYVVLEDFNAQDMEWIQPKTSPIPMKSTEV